MSVLVTQKAPDFTVPAVLGNGEIIDKLNFHEFIENKYAVLFFYPLDFTFVCPSELIALNKRLDAFKERQVEVLSVSIDSHFTHNAYRGTPIKNGGIGQIGYTMLSDMNHNICQAYGVQHPEAAVALRAAFVIDNKGIVRSEIINDLPIGRNIDEIIRTVDAVQFFEEHGDVCPAGWQKGQPAMNASPTGVAEYLTQNNEVL